MRRRDLLRLALAQTSLAYLFKGCQKEEGTPQPGPITQAYELTDGKTLYDDFDGNGSLQSYNNQFLAEAGKLSSRLWQPSGEVEVVRDPAAAGLWNVVNEENQRVEYRLDEESGRETRYVFAADGSLLSSLPHLPGRPYHASSRIFWVGAQDGFYQTERGGKTIVFPVEKGKVYGSAQPEFSEGRGWILRLTNRLPGLILCLLSSPWDIDFVDFKTVSADVMLSSASAAQDYYAALSYHTTIPEQPPGKSWFTDLGIRRYPNGTVYLLAQCMNVNTGYQAFMHLGEAQLDNWYNLRLDVVTREEDLSLQDNELRLEYYVDGVLKGTEVPEDSALLLDPERLGYGPNRSLIVYNEQAEGDGVAFFDNVKAVYKNRLRLG